MKITRALLILILAVLAVPSSHAAAMVDSARIGVGCRDDFKRFCKGAAAGTLIQCMDQHRAELGEACRSAIDVGKKGTGASTNAQRPPSCKDDFVRVCKGVKSGELRSCLKTHRAELSDFCRKIYDMTYSKEKSAAR